MAKKVNKENENIYYQLRNKLHMSREVASEKIGISPSTLQAIENEDSFPSPDVIYAMAKAYREPLLCNHYCSMECPLGIKYVHKIETKDLTRIALETVDAINTVSDNVRRFISITKDGDVSDNELREFIRTQIELEKLSKSVLTLQFWSREMIAEGVLNKSDYERVLQEEIELPKKKKRKAQYEPID